MRSRSWRWLRVRVEGLLHVPPQAFGTKVMQSTRLGAALYPIRQSGR